MVYVVFCLITPILYPLIALLRCLAMTSEILTEFHSAAGFYDLSTAIDLAGEERKSPLQHNHTRMRQRVVMWQALVTHVSGLELSNRSPAT